MYACFTTFCQLNCDGLVVLWRLIGVNIYYLKEEQINNKMPLISELRTISCIRIRTWLIYLPKFELCLKWFVCITQAFSVGKQNII